MVGVVNNSVGIDVAFNGVDVDIDIVFAILEDGTKACTDDSNATIQKKRTYDMILFMMKSCILLSGSFELDTNRNLATDQDMYLTIAIDD